MRRWRLALCLLLLPSAAWAQGAVQWWGPGVQGHLPMLGSGGSAPLLMDAGGSPGAGQQPANNALAGTLPTGVGFINTGQGVCQWTGYASAAYSELCSGFDGSGNALFTVDRIGGGTPPTCNFKINGVLFPCGSSGGTITEIDITANNGITLTPNPITSVGTVACTPASATLFGCVPASGGGTTKVLRADFTWVDLGLGTFMLTTGANATAAALDNIAVAAGQNGLAKTDAPQFAGLGVCGTATSGQVNFWCKTFITDPGPSTIGILEISGVANSTSGATINMLGNGATTPSKTLRVLSGHFGIMNDAYTTEILTLTDAGALSVASTITSGSSGVPGSLTMGNATSGTITLQPTTGALGTITATLQAANQTLAALDVANQVVTGGFHVTSNNIGTISSGTLTVACGTRDLQYFTNNGAFTLAADSSDGSCAYLMVNGASAGAVTLSGFTLVGGVCDGAALDTTNAHQFQLRFTRINGVSGCEIKAYQ